MDEEKIHLLNDNDDGASKNYGSSPNEKYYDPRSKNCTSPPTQLSSISPTIDTSSRRRSSIAAIAAAAESKYMIYVHIKCTHHMHKTYTLIILLYL